MTDGFGTILTFHDEFVMIKGFINSLLFSPPKVQVHLFEKIRIDWVKQLQKVSSL
jgi:hypothetical protein